MDIRSESCEWRLKWISNLCVISASAVDHPLSSSRNRREHAEVHKDSSQSENHHLGALPY